MSLRWLLVPWCLCVVLGAVSARAACPAGPGSSVSVSYSDMGTTVTFEVLDGAALDFDPDPREITANFEFGASVPPPQPWTATGTITAVSNADGFAETLLTNLLIENTGGPVDAVELVAQHCYDNQITIPLSFKAPVDGALLNTFDGQIREVELASYSAHVSGQALSGGFSEHAVAVQGPVPFLHLLGPTSVQMLPPRASQTHTLFFYLDSPGDAIRLPNSALIQPSAAGLPAVSASSILVAGGLLAAAGLCVRALRGRTQRMS